ncbi:hypothetical protein B2G44_00130 [Candidatus Phytoplasma citri]|uniref:Uncharacterized protein n=1 Tax=Candidatus Phytoplasma citri TaxID=180978 RepID=A0A1S9M5K9_9MOLU|nr:hypothetical protein B2G44_00130 [Candidatus Phytoplasma aurantifolia]
MQDRIILQAIEQLLTPYLMVQVIILYFRMTRNLSQLTYSKYITESICLETLPQTNGKKPPSLEVSLILIVFIVLF